MNHVIYQTKSVGFTIVEMLIIAPIVILVIGTFISAIVNMTGEILMTRGANALAYSIQDALNRIEADVKLSTTFLAKNSITPSSPQGYDDIASDFTNVGANGNILILNTLATTGNPLSTTSGLVYLNNVVDPKQPNACNSTQINQNTPMTMNVIYFVKNNTLWRRTIAPLNYLTAGCVVPWQQPSCDPLLVGGFCKTKDVRLVDNVDIEDFVVQYFNSASATVADNIASSTGQTDDQRYAALQSDTTVVASLSVSKMVAGRDINQSGAIRSTRLDVNASTIAPIIPDIVPAAPTVIASISPTAPATATFTWATVPGAATYSLDYRVDPWNPVTRTNSTGTWTNGFSNDTVTTYSRTVNHGDKVYVRVTATNTEGTSGYGNSIITIPVWATYQFQNLWANYGGSYTPAGFTKNSDGVIILRGMVKKASGTLVQNEVIGTLPVGYRPAQRIIFQISSGSTDGRIDINSSGDIKVYAANPGWLSLDGIMFIPTGSSLTNNLASPLLNGWTVYGGDIEPPFYVVDSYGRVFFQGVVRPGTVTNSTQIYDIPDNLLPPLYTHIQARSGTFSHIALEHRTTMANGIVAKGATTSDYLSWHFLYYPAGVGSWTNLALQNGWVWYNALYSSPQYTKAPDGLVTLKGLIGSGTATAGTVAATLPAGYRPAYKQLLTTVSYGAWCRIDVLTTGEILVMQGCSSGWLSLDGITFYAEQ